MQLHAAYSRGSIPSTPPENDGAGYAESGDNGGSIEDSDDDDAGFDTDFEQECNQPLTSISNRILSLISNRNTNEILTLISKTMWRRFNVLDTDFRTGMQ